MRRLSSLFILSTICINTLFANNVSVAVPISSEIEQAELREMAAPVVKQNGKSVETIKPITSFISQKDSVKLRKEAIVESQFNPLFMDWVVPNSVLPQAVDTTTELNRLRYLVKQEILESNPELYMFHFDNLPPISDFELQPIEVKQPNTFQMDMTRLLPTKEDIKLDLPKPSNWFATMLIQLQGTQNYISENWYNGGESNLSVISYVNAKAIYNNNKNIQWESNFSIKTGANSSQSDTVHTIRMNNDEVNLNSKLGIKAVKNWYYTGTVDLSFPLFETYLANSYERSAAFVSPLRFVASVGMDYKYKKIFSVTLSPLAMKIVYVNDTARLRNASQSIADRAGIDAGEKVLKQIGSAVTFDIAHSFSKELELRSKMKIYTNYKGIEWDWEINGNFIINRYLSANVSLHPRFDSTVKQVDGLKPKLQFKEYISLGFNYRL